MQLRKLAGQTVVYGVSSIAARLLNYLLTPYFTRIFTEPEYGVVTDVYALIPFALVVLTLGMESGYFRFAGRAADEPGRRRVFATAWGTTGLAALLFLIAALVFNRPLAQAMEYGDHPGYVSFVAGIVFLDTVSAIPFARLRQMQRAGRFVALKVLSVAVNVALCFAFGAFGLYDTGFGVGYVFVANFAASAVTFAALLPDCDGVWPRIDRRLLRSILLYSLPLLLSGIAGTANEFIDRQMIKYLLPADIALGQVGIYGAVVKIGVVMLLFTQMYRYAAEPFFLARFDKRDFALTNAAALKYYLIVSIAIFLGIALFADLFALIVGPDFREGMFILPLVLGANMLSGTVLNLSFWYKQTGRTAFALAVTCTGLVFTVVFNVLLVPRLGYYGAAWARLICEAAMVVVSYALNRRYCPAPYDLWRIGQYIGLGALLYGLGFLTARLTPVPHYAVNAAMVAGYLGYAVRRERIDVRGLVRSVLKRK